MKRLGGRVLISGSLAYDHIFDFPGRFAQHILPEKIHLLSVSFLVTKMVRHWGGTGGNIAYNLSLLGGKPLLLAPIGGKDFGSYQKHLEESGVDLCPSVFYPDEFTSTSFVITDQTDNQIAAFYPGVMSRARKLPLKKWRNGVSLMIISPNDPAAMIAYAKECQDTLLPYVFDPGQQIPRLSGKDLRAAIAGAKVLVGNDYEMELVRQKTGWTDDEILGRVEVMTTTLGEKGSLIHTRQEKLMVPAVTVRKAIDPTGAGDAYRAGLIKGMIEGWSWQKTGRVAATAASFAVEKYGTQEHGYSSQQFVARYQKNFGSFHTTTSDFGYTKIIVSRRKI